MHCAQLTRDLFAIAKFHCSCNVYVSSFLTTPAIRLILGCRFLCCICYDCPNLCIVHYDTMTLVVVMTYNMSSGTLNSTVPLVVVVIPFDDHTVCSLLDINSQPNSP